MRHEQVILVLDTSGSINSIAQPYVNALNTLLNNIAEDAARRRNTANITVRVIPFAYRVAPGESFPASQSPEYVMQHVPYTEASRKKQILFAGSTNINDALAEALNATNAGAASNLVYVLTDGEHNVTSAISGSDLVPMVRRFSALPNVTITFMGTEGARGYALNLGIPPGNIEVWEQTARGTEVMRQVTTSAYQQYSKSMEQGKQKVNDFYATSDASKIGKRQLNKLLDITGKLQRFDVKQDITVGEFTKRKTRRNYVTGQTYYQLVKRETIEPERPVVLYHRTTSRLYGGDEARNLIGIPLHEKCKVTPGNHGDFEIYVQSRADNRKLPRGTTAYIDVEKRSAEKPTWESKVS